MRARRGCAHPFLLVLTLLLFHHLTPLRAVHSTQVPPYSPEHLASHHDAERCSLPVLESLDDFHSFFPSRPFLLRGLTRSASHSRFTALSSPAALLSSLAPFNVTLASAETYSYAKRSEPFSTYLQRITQQPVDLHDRANDTWYWVSGLLHPAQQPARH